MLVIFANLKKINSGTLNFENDLFSSSPMLMYDKSKLPRQSFQIMTTIILSKRTCESDTLVSDNIYVSDFAIDKSISFDVQLLAIN